MKLFFLNLERSLQFCNQRDAAIVGILQATIHTFPRFSTGITAHPIAKFGIGIQESSTKCFQDRSCFAINQSINPQRQKTHYVEEFLHVFLSLISFCCVQTLSPPVRLIVCQRLIIPVAQGEREENCMAHLLETWCTYFLLDLNQMPQNSPRNTTRRRKEQSVAIVSSAILKLSNFARRNPPLLLLLLDHHKQMQSHDLPFIPYVASFGTCNHETIHLSPLHKTL